MDKNVFIEKFTGRLPKDISSATPQQLHNALGETVMELYSQQWSNARGEHLSKRRAAYLSMEFLVGRAVYNNLLCLGIYNEVNEAFSELGLNLADLEVIEDAALGNGGLGRLAACFLDSAATLGLPLDGYGIRYKYGLFRQTIEDGFQREYIDDWTRYGDPWSVRCDEDTVLIKFNGQIVKAVPYDMPIFGCKTENIGTLRLWQAEPVKEFDFETFNNQQYLEASKEKVFAEDISRVLYPNDDTNEGKKLRLKQQYFFSAASLTDIIKKHKARFGTLDNLADYISIQLNDTHPVISVPELIRQLVNEIIYKHLAAKLNRAKLKSGEFDSMDGIENLDKVICIDQSPIGRTPRSNPATYTGVFSDIRDLFAKTNDAKAHGYTSGRFSFNVKGGRCEACEGDGIIKIEMHFLPDIYVPCEVCKGRRYNRETLEVHYKGKSIYDVLEMTVDEGVEFFEHIPKIARKLKTLQDVGLGYIKIGQPATTLSGGEAQRVKLSTELSKRPTGKTIYILDEPTTGLHTADVHKLIEVLHKLSDQGNTVLVIEHNLNVIKVADHIIDLGPEGGDGGGTIVAQGTPEEIAACEASYTGQYLKSYLK